MKPLALLQYASILPGGQLASKLEDLGYRVHTLARGENWLEVCEREKPLVLLTELTQDNGALEAVAKIKQNPATSHVPVLAFAGVQDKALQDKARQAGVSLLVGSVVVVEHLPQLLDQVLQVE